jgi:hypothetical protein
MLEAPISFGNRARKLRTKFFLTVSFAVKSDPSSTAHQLQISSTSGLTSIGLPYIQSAIIAPYLEQKFDSMGLIAWEESDSVVFESVPFFLLRLFVRLVLCSVVDLILARVFELLSLHLRFSKLLCIMNLCLNIQTFSFYGLLKRLNRRLCLSFRDR